MRVAARWIGIVLGGGCRDDNEASSVVRSGVGRVCVWARAAERILGDRAPGALRRMGDIRRVAVSADGFLVHDRRRDGRMMPRRASKQRPWKVRNKFGAVRTNGYASKLEARYAADLAARKAAPDGDVLAWIEQTPIKLPGGTRYVVDFLVFKRDGSWEFVEVKGKSTDVWKMKMRLMAEAHPELYSRLTVVGDR
jgi:hypothetical protein